MTAAALPQHRPVVHAAQPGGCFRAPIGSKAPSGFFCGCSEQDWGYKSHRRVRTKVDKVVPQRGHHKPLQHGRLSVVTTGTSCGHQLLRPPENTASLEAQTGLHLWVQT